MGKKVEKNTDRLGRDPLQDVKRLIGEEKDKSNYSKQSKLNKQSSLRKQSKSSNQESFQETSPNVSLSSEPISTSESSQEKSSSKIGLKDGWIRGTYILREKWAETIKDYAYWERLEIKEVLDLVLEAFFKDKKVKPRTKKTS